MKSFLTFLKENFNKSREDHFNWNKNDLVNNKKKPVTDRSHQFSWNSGELEKEILKEKQKLKEDAASKPYESPIVHNHLTPEQHKDFENHRKKFNDTHAKYLRKYKNDSSELNEELRRKRELGEVHKHFSQAMDHITSQKIKHPMTVYRGFGREFDHSTLTPGSIHKDHGYTGTSIDPKVSKEFSHNNVLAQIHVPAGSKGHHLDLPNHPLSHSGFADEHEFLLHRGTRFKVSHHSHHIDPESGEYYKIVHMHVLPGKEKKKKFVSPDQMHFPFHHE